MPFACRLLSAIDAASVPLAEDMVAQLDLTDKQHPEVMPHLKPLCTAIDMVFGSAAALSATFGFKVTPLLPVLATHAGGHTCLWQCLQYSDG